MSKSEIVTTVLSSIAIIISIFVFWRTEREKLRKPEIQKQIAIENVNKLKKLKIIKNNNFLESIFQFKRKDKNELSLFEIKDYNNFIETFMELALYLINENKLFNFKDKRNWKKTTVKTKKYLNYIQKFMKENKTIKYEFIDDKNRRQLVYYVQKLIFSNISLDNVLKRKILNTYEKNSNHIFQKELFSFLKFKLKASEYYLNYEIVNPFITIDTSPYLQNYWTIEINEVLTGKFSNQWFESQKNRINIFKMWIDNFDNNKWVSELPAQKNLKTKCKIHGEDSWTAVYEEKKNLQKVDGIDYRKFINNNHEIKNETDKMPQKIFAYFQNKNDEPIFIVSNRKYSFEEILKEDSYFENNTGIDDSSFSKNSKSLKIFREFIKQTS